MDDVDRDQMLGHDKLLRHHVAQLLEHFDSVRIFVTGSERGESRPVAFAGSQGGGNFYATLGQVREWLVQQDHRACIQVEIIDRENEDDMAG